MAKHPRLSVCLHCFNWLQAIRLLATRGHYSIDLIIVYVVESFVSTPTERLGLYYSRGIQPVLPGIVEMFGIKVGVSAAELSRSNINTQHCEHQEDTEKAISQATSLQADDGMSSYDNLHNVPSELSVRISVDIVAKAMPEQMR